ncbi:MAG: 50S ribosomal protein L23 [Patescibacteria group bacterium]
MAGTSAYRVLQSLYVSEKASRLAGSNQYVFRVTPDANKEEIKKQISRLYGVTVTAVRVLNMPKKRKDLGRHPGFRSGFRKAVVRLAKGQTIAQATP